MNDQTGWRADSARQRRSPELGRHGLPQLPRLVHRAPGAPDRAELARSARSARPAAAQRRQSIILTVVGVPLAAILALQVWQFLGQ